MDVKVTRAGKTLPISEVPNLQPGDRLWMHPAFPDNETVHYVLAVAFLQGATNPPPESWFTRAATWAKQVKKDGIVITVPEHAQQALFFLAPQTAGDFSTLRSAVRGKPGAFVRAAQDLNLASQSRMRVDKYLNAIGEVKDPKVLHERSTLLARSLKIKVDEKCFDKPSEQQAACLMQNSDQMVMDDGHGQSMLAALTAGPESDLVGAVSATKQAGGGTYSPYVGVVMDMAKVMESLHTAQYQYIPALTPPEREQLNLKLNNPPSFHKPMSVLVAALPPVKAVSPPVLTPVEPKQVYCLENPTLAMEADGAPLVFATEIAHGFTLHIRNKEGKSVDVPVKADASRGGIVVDGTLPKMEGLGAEVRGTLHGSWGYESFEGPTFELRNVSEAAQWKLTAEDQSALVVGREDTFHLHSEIAACVENITIKNEHDKTAKTSWKLIAPDEIEVKVSLAGAEPGTATMAIKQFAVAKAIEILLHTYAEEGHLDQFTIHAGDQQGILKGARLDQVASVEINGAHFLPTSLTRVEKLDQLSVSVEDAKAPAFAPEQKLTTNVTLKDGRVLKLQTTVEAQRPKLTLINKRIQTAQSAIRLGSPDDLPLNGRLSFFVKSQIPATFRHDEKIEVTSADGFFHTVLSLADKNLSLQDSQTAVAVLDPLKSFGESAFGSLQFRPVVTDGSEGDWQPLAHLVRLPHLAEVRCPDDPDKQCTLGGDNLYLIDSVASDREFTKAVSVPSGFAETSLTVPRPVGTVLYIKLRDDPTTINAAALPVLPDQQ
ncbi:MAG: hypothetical protein ABSD13_11475 [Candidatus Korobacteraceae bacterium]|jgi:hypothetical protein